ncbi:GfV-C11-ORF2 [Ichnoviriform fumiferanae]|uniref:GfV-C11-ORF2 n=1 Tax=Ichnoviriform fumiferanae TaxID=419435 RepID=A2PZX9_9VIRU|nr:GfV-C11-ORF2 [Ichnoviriform fumiferanae]BAF45551.1 GfV-C11-ORF2 [Ichnoviriform fumiferanae]
MHMPKLYAKSVSIEQTINAQKQLQLDIFNDDSCLRNLNVPIGREFISKEILPRDILAWSLTGRPPKYPAKKFSQKENPCFYYCSSEQLRCYGSRMSSTMIPYCRKLNFFQIMHFLSQWIISRN